MGMMVAGLGLLGVGILYIFIKDPAMVNGYALGGSSIALFARVGGGISVSYTHLDVYKRQIQSHALGGIDSLLSIVQMPRGIPVATVAINGAFNAGLLAVQIIACLLYTSRCV